MPLANELIAALRAIAEPGAIDGVRRFFTGSDPGTQVMGVSIGKVFPIAKHFADLPLTEVEALLEDTRYEVRMAAVSILDFKARDRKLGDEARKAVFDLYLRRHDRINNWDLVDRAAPHVIGEYLVDRDRTVLDELALSDDPHRRRTALVATHAFIKRGDVADTFRIAAMLAGDPDTYVQKAIGSWTREAGKRDQAALIRFLRDHADVLPKSTVTAAAKLLSEKDRRDARL